MRALKVKAHAKINLYLRVTGKRSDGYHDIETVFQSIGLADSLTLQKNVRLEIQADHPQLPSPEENLIFRAAELLRAKAGRAAGAAIDLTKNIPIAAGLAGGSADAAAALTGLNQLWELGLTRPQLQKIGSEIGADVPFCLRGGTMFGYGKGDSLEVLPPLPSLNVVLAKPAFSISSRQLYQIWDESGHPDLVGNPSTMREAIARGDNQAIASNLVNTLEQVAVKIYPEIGKLKQSMIDAGALGAQMSGSGPAVFALAESPETAGRIARAVDRICPFVMMTKTYPKGIDIEEYQIED